MKKSLCAVILAAGNSSRFGSNKLLYMVNKQPMYQYSIDLIKLLQPNATVIVTKYPEIIREIQKNNHDSSFIIVENHHTELGQSHSMKLGIFAAQKLNRNFDGYLFMVSDQPYLTLDSLKKLQQTWQEQGGICALSFEKRRGNPVIFSAQYIPELLDISGDSGGRVIIKNHLSDLTLVTANSAKELQDIDRQDELLAE